jgi:histidinol phosphatase-like PHP family hydrolase
MRTWMNDEVGVIADPQEFMDTLVERAVGILEGEPIDIYVNPTFIPDQLSKDYDRLWTPARMQQVVNAAAKNKVAIELNDRYKLPGAAFVKLAKAAGCKFTFGTNNTNAEDLGRSEYGLKMIDECKLQWNDFFVPGAFWPKAIDRKGDLLKA